MKNKEQKQLNKLAKELKKSNVAIVCTDRVVSIIGTLEELNHYFVLLLKTVQKVTNKSPEEFLEQLNKTFKDEELDKLYNDMTNNYFDKDKE